MRHNNKTCKSIDAFLSIKILLYSNSQFLLFIAAFFPGTQGFWGFGEIGRAHV